MDRATGGRSALAHRYAAARGCLRGCWLLLAVPMSMACRTTMMLAASNRSTSQPDIGASVCVLCYWRRVRTLQRLLQMDSPPATTVFQKRRSLSSSCLLTACHQVPPECGCLICQLLWAGVSPPLVMRAGIAVCPHSDRTLPRMVCGGTSE